MTVHTRCARAALGIGVGQDVLTADLVVQGAETIVAVERERVTLGRADYPPILGPVDKAVTAVRRGYHGVRTAFRKCPATADRAIGTRRGPDRNCVLFGVNGQRRKAGRAPLIASRVVESDIVYVGVRLKAARFRVYRERDGLRRCRHGSGR